MKRMFAAGRYPEDLPGHAYADRWAPEDEMKYYPTHAVLSLSTGRLFTSFSDMHETAEFLAGRSLMSHEFADRPLVSWLKAQVDRQHPWLLGIHTARIDAAKDKAAACDEILAECIAAHGAMLGLEPGRWNDSGSFSRPLMQVSSAYRDGDVPEDKP